MVNKMWIVMFGLSLLLLLHGGMVESETSQSVIPLTPSEDEEYDDYTVYKLLEEALVSDFNRYKLQRTFFSDDLILCLPVTYHLHCEKQVNCSNSINCSGKVPFSQSYLWTLFNTETFAGRFLLYFTKNRLRSPLLGIPDHFCRFSSQNGIFLYLDVESFPCLQSNVSTEDVISKTLIQITGRLNVFVVSNGQPASAGGYGLRWTSDTQHYFTKQTAYSEYYVPIPLILVAIFIGINGSSKVSHFFSGELHKRKGKFLAFWSFQCVIAVVNVLNIIYIIKSNPTGAQAHIVTIGTLSFAFLYAVFIVLRRKKNLKYYIQRCIKNITNRKKTSAAETIELQSLDAQDDSEEHILPQNEDSTAVNIDDIQVPCTSWSCCKGIHHMRTKNLFVVIATVNTFLFFLFMAYTLPWVVLGFYLFPIKVLARISFLFAAALCLMLSFAWILKHIEKLALDCECHNLQFQTTKKTCKNVFGLVTSVIVLILLLLMGGLLYHIVFVFNSNNNTKFEELLTILPGLALSASAYVLHGKLSLPETLGFEKKEEVKYRLVKEDDFINMIPV